MVNKTKFESIFSKIFKNLKTAQIQGGIKGILAMEIQN